jgi:hypothetical protein
MQTQLKQPLQKKPQTAPPQKERRRSSGGGGGGGSSSSSATTGPATNAAAAAAAGPNNKKDEFSDQALDQMMAKLAAVEMMANPRRNSRATVPLPLKPETDLTMHDLIAQAKRNAAQRRKSQMSEASASNTANNSPRFTDLDSDNDLPQLPVHGGGNGGNDPSSSSSSSHAWTERPETPEPQRGGSGGGATMTPATGGGAGGTLPHEGLLDQEQELIDLHELHIHEHAKIVESETHLLESVTGNFDYRWVGGWVGTVDGRLEKSASNLPLPQYCPCYHTRGRKQGGSATAAIRHSHNGAHASLQTAFH